MSPIIIWTILFALFLFLEFLVPGDFITIWFAFGAIVSCILAAFKVDMTIRIISFLAISGISLILFRPICLKLIKKNAVKTPLNTMVGMKIKIIEPILEDKMGTTKIDGVIFSCMTSDDSEVASGTYCTVIEVNGNKLVVKPEL